MPAIRDLKAFRLKHSEYKVAAHAARANGVTNQTFQILEEEGAYKASLWTVCRYFWALGCAVEFTVTARDGSVHDVALDIFDDDFEYVMTHGKQPPRKSNKVLKQEAKVRPRTEPKKKRRKGISPVPKGTKQLKGTGPSTPRLPAKPNQQTREERDWEDRRDDIEAVIWDLLKRHPRTVYSFERISKAVKKTAPTLYQGDDDDWDSELETVIWMMYQCDQIQQVVERVGSKKPPKWQYLESE